MLVIGLTGGIAMGKSSVSRRLQSHEHVAVIDADLIAKEIVLPQKPAYLAILKAFIKDVPDLVLADGQLNREALGKHVFGNKSALKQLNGITHPAVIREILSQLINNWLKGTPIVVLDVPLLFETHLNWICHEVVVVDCSSDVQLKRLVKRNNMSETEAQKRIKSQIGRDVRLRLSDIILDNNGDLENLNTQVEQLVLRWNGVRWYQLCWIYLKNRFINRIYKM